MRNAVILFAILLLSGCGGKIVWDKSGATQADFNTDNYDCEYKSKVLAEASTGYQQSNDIAGAFGAGVGRGIAVAMAQRTEYINCMKAKGYYERKEVR